MILLSEVSTRADKAGAQLRANLSTGGEVVVRVVPSREELTVVVMYREKMGWKRVEIVNGEVKG